jgi:hypothetical protein
MRYFPLVVLVAVLFPAPCFSEGATAVSDKALATIKDVPIRETEFSRYVAGGWTMWTLEIIRTNETARQDAMDAYFDLRVLAAKAQKDGIDRKPAFQKASELMEMKILVKLITERDRTKLVGPTNLSESELRISEQRLSGLHQAYMSNLQQEMELKKMPAATNNAPLEFSRDAKTNEMLATLGGIAIRQSDFEWFLKDAYRPEQRMYVFSQPGARRRLLASYLDMRTLEAKARKDGLDKQPEFQNEREVLHVKLLAEFLQERDRTTPWLLPGATDEAKHDALKNYLSQLRQEMDFKTIGPVRSSPVGKNLTIR